MTKSEKSCLSVKGVKIDFFTIPSAIWNNKSNGSRSTSLNLKNHCERDSWSWEIINFSFEKKGLKTDIQIFEFLENSNKTLIFMWAQFIVTWSDQIIFRLMNTKWSLPSERLENMLPEGARQKYVFISNIIYILLYFWRVINYLRNSNIL